MYSLAKVQKRMCKADAILHRVGYFIVGSVQKDFTRFGININNASLVVSHYSKILYHHVWSSQIRKTPLQGERVLSLPHSHSVKLSAVAL